MIDLDYILWLMNGELGDQQKYYNEFSDYARLGYEADVGPSPVNNFLKNKMSQKRGLITMRFSQARKKILRDLLFRIIGIVFLVDITNIEQKYCNLVVENIYLKKSSR